MTALFSEFLTVGADSMHTRSTLLLALVITCATGTNISSICIGKTSTPRRISWTPSRHHQGHNRCLRFCEDVSATILRRAGVVAKKTGDPMPLRQFDVPLVGELPKSPNYYRWYETIAGPQMPSMSASAVNTVLVAVKRRLVVFDYAKGRMIGSYDARHSIGAAAMSPDGRFAILQLCEKVHETGDSSWNCRLVLYDLHVGAIVRSYGNKLLCPRNCFEMRCSFLDGGNLVFAFNSFNGDMKIWNTRTGKLVWSEEFCAQGGADSVGNRILRVRICSTPGDEPTESALIEFPQLKKIATCGKVLTSRRALSMDVPQDGKHVVFGVAEEPPGPPGPWPEEPRQDGYVASVVVSTAECKFRTDQLATPRNYGSVSSVTVTRDGSRIVACTKRGLVVLDGNTGTELSRWEPDLRVKSGHSSRGDSCFTPLVKAIISPDEKTIIACDFWGRVTVWPVVYNK